MVERSLSDQQFICENSQTPEINCHIILSSLENLRCSVIECSTVCFSTLITDCWPTEITQFTRAIRHDNVLGFDISMSNTILMHVYYSFGNLLYFPCCLQIIEFFLLFQNCVKCALLHIIQNQVNALWIVEKSIQCQNLLVIHECL